MNTSVHPAMTISSASDAANRELLRWQRHLLPFVTWFVVALATGFFVLSVLDFIELKKVAGSTSNAGEMVAGQIAKEPSAALTRDQVVQQSLLLLEANALDKRYSQASALLLSRTLTKQLSFLTGIVLAFLGAIFILAKLSESTTQVDGSMSQWQLKLSSASPGLILSLFGAVLLIVSLVVQTNTISVLDKPVYLGSFKVTSPAGATTSSNNNVDQSSGAFVGQSSAPNNQGGASVSQQSGASVSQTPPGSSR
jgi:hypothetical protein